MCFGACLPQEQHQLNGHATNALMSLDLQRLTYHREALRRHNARQLSSMKTTQATIQLYLQECAQQWLVRMQGDACNFNDEEKHPHCRAPHQAAVSEQLLPSAEGNDADEEHDCKCG